MRPTHRLLGMIVALGAWVQGSIKTAAKVTVPILLCVPRNAYAGFRMSGMGAKSVGAAFVALLVAMGQAAALNLNSALIIVAVIIGAVVGLSVIAALMPTWFSSLGSVVDTFETSTTGNADADALLPTFGLLAAFAGIFAIVGLVLLVVRIRRGG